MFWPGRQIEKPTKMVVTKRYGKLLDGNWISNTFLYFVAHPYVYV